MPGEAHQGKATGTAAHQALQKKLCAASTWREKDTGIGKRNASHSAVSFPCPLQTHLNITLKREMFKRTTSMIAEQIMKARLGADGDK